MVYPVQVGKRTRMNFAKVKDMTEMPNLIEIRLDSYKWLLDARLYEILDSINPISNFTRNLVLEFVGCTLDMDNIEYSVKECKERGVIYAAPLRVAVGLQNKRTGEIKGQEVFMGGFPLTTGRGASIVNGAKKVIISQLVRSPGVYYNYNIDKTGKKLLSTTIIPNRGAWLEYETDSNDVVYVRIDKTGKLPISTLGGAMGFGSDQELLEYFGEEERFKATIERGNIKTKEEALLRTYKRLRPGKPPTVDSATSLIDFLFLDAKKYDLSRVGRYKFNKKPAIGLGIVNQIAAEDIVDKLTGGIPVTRGEKISRASAEEIQNRGINSVDVLVEDRVIKIIDNHFVDIHRCVGFDISDLNIRKLTHYPTLRGVLGNYSDEETIREEIKRDVIRLIPKHIVEDDIFATISCQVGLAYNIGYVDDMDHLGNRRLRSVGEFLQNQFRIGLSRIERVVKERMAIQDQEAITPQRLISVGPVAAAIKEFFGSSQLSQFMDQTNPSSELTHKRKLSALGSGGLSRERTGFEVRDIHHSYYGRVYPIETPGGPNIGLVSPLATYAKVNEYDFVETPYRVVDKAEGRVTGEIGYFTADEEGQCLVAQASEPLDENGCFTDKKVAVRDKGEVLVVPSKDVDLMGVSPGQLVSIAAAMIPLLESDDASKALMGSNMQCQVVPLSKPYTPVVGTGIKYKVVIDSGALPRAKNAGEVIYVSTNEVRVKRELDGGADTYKLLEFKRSNQGTCINQKPMVARGDWVLKGKVLASGLSTDLGKITLGKSIRMGLVTWEGHNYEDAMLISRELVREDVLTSIHIGEYECEARGTKLGPEEITRDIPSVSEDTLKDIGERGIIRVSAEVRSGDILVGKVTPKGETELTAEERLLRAIFSEEAREVRDTPLRVPHGEAGVIVDVKVFTRGNGDDLSPGVSELIRYYIARKRKISVGDKMTGRHGNKGVISRVLSEGDMPFLPDDRPLQICLNSLGVPFRMNIGQVLKVHLGWAASALGWHIAAPIFDGTIETDIESCLEKIGYSRNGKTVLRGGRTGEEFDDEVTVGIMYILKLVHLVDDKIHARSTGPYSLVTQRPLGGKAQFGGQRFGEMEVWALEAYGTAHTLQEILTVKSGDVIDRAKTYEAVVKGESIPEPGVPESSRVFTKELQALCLDAKVLSDNNQEVKFKELAEGDGGIKVLEINIEGTGDSATEEAKEEKGETYIPAEEIDEEIDYENIDLLDFTSGLDIEDNFS